MSVPWTPGYTASVLAKMSDEQLARCTTRSFQMHPCEVVLPSQTGKDLLAQERARRANVTRTAAAAAVEVPPQTAPQVPPEPSPTPAPARPKQASLFE